MNLRDRVAAAVTAGNLEELGGLVAGEKRAVRHLVALTYRTEPGIRETAARGLALAGRHHPRLVQEVARRLVWAMNDESGTNGVTAPAVLRTIAEETPHILLPLIPELLRLTADEQLRDELVEVVRRAARHDPHAALHGMERAIAGCEKRRQDDAGNRGPL